LLIRHGRTSFNAERRFCGGRSDPGLDERGREQVAELGDRLRGEVHRVYSSPQRRAVETAAALAPEPTILEQLRELDQGELEGLEIAPSLAERAEFFSAWRRDPSELKVPGGESMAELAERVGAGMDRIVAELDTGDRSEGGQVVAVVGHQMAQAAFVCRALGESLRRWHEFELRNARANLLLWDGEGWTLAGRNL
jgi:broad specificity phosphatase PhoE